MARNGFKSLYEALKAFMKGFERADMIVLPRDNASKNFLGNLHGARWQKGMVLATLTGALSEQTVVDFGAGLTGALAFDGTCLFQRPHRAGDRRF